MASISRGLSKRLALGFPSSAFYLSDPKTTASEATNSFVLASEREKKTENNGQERSCDLPPQTLLRYQVQWHQGREDPWYVSMHPNLNTMHTHTQIFRRSIDANGRSGRLDVSLFAAATRMRSSILRGFITALDGLEQQVDASCVMSSITSEPENQCSDAIGGTDGSPAVECLLRSLVTRTLVE